MKRAFAWTSIITGYILMNIASATVERVVYITLDGVRWQNVFEDQNALPHLLDKYGQKLAVYGQPNSGTHIEVASIAVSMPSYESQTTGKVQECQSNGCPRVPETTFLETVKNTLNLPRKEVAVFASWGTIALTAEHEEGSLVVNAGNNPMTDPVTGIADNDMSLINKAQANDFPYGNTRYDKYTFEQGFHYLRKYQPKLLWISLNDSDDHAHDGNKEAYHQSLRDADDNLVRLFDWLNEAGLAKETAVILTTDHGRGDGDNWTKHGKQYPESKRTWAFTYNSTLEPVLVNDDAIYYNTLSIAPTVKKLLLD